jgi:diguanylate cyclase (GGDEF)-like protein
VELEREVARAIRSGQPLVVAFLDVDHLKAVNDASGHAAGDQMLVEIASTIRRELRPYDLVIRYGGDEFVCAIAGLDKAAATKRLSRVNAVLARASAHGSVTAGIAELQPDDTLEDIIARADAELYRERQQQPIPPGASP